ncbi:MAG: hypothetical protein QW270_07005 [Candidatus Bathyarchaeia archaeon]
MDEEAKRLGMLPPEEKVLLAVDMSDFVVRVCAEGIKAQFPKVSGEKLLELLIKRLEWSKRLRKRGV